MNADKRIRRAGKFAVWTVELLRPVVSHSRQNPCRTRANLHYLPRYPFFRLYWSRTHRFSFISVGLLDGTLTQAFERLHADCALIPIANLLFAIGLLVLPSERRTDDERASGSNSSSELYDSKGQQLYSCYGKAVDPESGECRKYPGPRFLLVEHFSESSTTRSSAVIGFSRFPR